MWAVENRARYDLSRLGYPSDLTDEEWALVRSQTSEVPGRNVLVGKESGMDEKASKANRNHVVNGCYGTGDRLVEMLPMWPWPWKRGPRLPHPIHQKPEDPRLFSRKELLPKRVEPFQGQAHEVILTMIGGGCRGRHPRRRPGRRPGRRLRAFRFPVVGDILNAASVRTQETQA